MSDMRLIVAGAGGRMGRTLIKAIAETPGLRCPARSRTRGSPLIGQDAGELAGLGNNGIALTADAKALLAKADGIIDFTVPKATRGARGADRRQGVTSSAPPAIRRRRSQDQGGREERRRSSSPAT